MKDTYTDIEPTASDEERLTIIYTMAHMFEVLGYGNIRARAVGYDAPDILPGTIADHRPDITTTMPSGVTIFCEAVTDLTLTEPHLAQRWQLLTSAAKNMGGEIHFAFIGWSDWAGDMKQLFKTKIGAMGLTYNQAWVL